jgi:hypothetical protein
MTSALVAVPVEIRVLDVGSQTERVYRLAHSIATDAIRFERDLPFEPGRPVRVELTLPDDDAAIIAEGRIERPDLIALLGAETDVKERIDRYVAERNLLS